MKKLLFCAVLLLTWHLLQAQISTLFATGFNGSNGLAFDASGNLYVANYNNNTVSKVDASGSVTAIYTGFNCPYGLAFNNAGNLFVTNFIGNSISQVNASGVIIATFTGFNHPYGLAIDASGNLYVSNASANTVSKVDGSGNILATYMGFHGPGNIVIDTSGNLYVTNASNGTVSKVDASGTIIATYTGISFPVGLALDASGNLYIANITGHSISMIPAGSGDGTMAQAFVSGLPYNPNMLTYHDNALYVSDGNSNVNKITGGFPLPVNLVEFTVRQQNSIVTLSWQTADKINTTGFAIERSTDAVNYTYMGRVDARIGGDNNYHFKDDISTLKVPAVYYRLKMMDNDGNLTYSKAVDVRLKNDDTQNIVYPNPARDYINVNVAKAGLICIYNATGLLVKTQDLNVGSNKIDIRALGAGIYFTKVNGTRIKFIKQ